MAKSTAIVKIRGTWMNPRMVLLELYQPSLIDYEAAQERSSAQELVWVLAPASLETDTSEPLLLRYSLLCSDRGAR